MRQMKLKDLLKCALSSALLVCICTVAGQERTASPARYRDWKVYGGGLDNIHYSSLRQINRDNVRRLQVAWSYDSADAFPSSEMECNPIVVDGILYATTPKLRLIALDAATGKLRWSFGPDQADKTLGKRRNRGVTYWEDGNDRRVFFVASQYLYALDAMTGKPLLSFGDSGRLDLREGLGRDPKEQSIS